MRVHTEEIVSDRIVAKPGAQVDLRAAGVLLLPQMATAALPSAAEVNGMLVWDTTAHALKLAAGSTWEIVAIIE